MPRAISVLFIAVLAAFTLAACGGSEDSSPPSKAEYQQEYKDLSAQLEKVGREVGKAVNQSSGKSNKELKKTFGEVADQTREIAQKFDDATPPNDPKIETQVAKLVAGLKIAADDLDAISTAAGKNNLRAAGEAAGKLTRDNAKVAEPKQELDLLVLGIKPAQPQTTTTTTKKK